MRYKGQAYRDQSATHAGFRRKTSIVSISGQRALESVAITEVVNVRVDASGIRKKRTFLRALPSAQEPAPAASTEHAKVLLRRAIGTAAVSTIARRCSQAWRATASPSQSSGESTVFDHNQVFVFASTARAPSSLCGKGGDDDDEKRRDYQIRSTFEIFKNLFLSIAGEMGITLLQHGIFAEHRGANGLLLRGVRRAWAAGPSRRATICPYISARCRSPLVQKVAIERVDDGARRRRRILNDPFRGGSAPARHHSGAAAFYGRRGRAGFLTLANLAPIVPDVGGMRPETDAAGAGSYSGDPNPIRRCGSCGAGKPAKTSWPLASFANVRTPVEP